MPPRGEQKGWALCKKVQMKIAEKVPGNGPQQIFTIDIWTKLFHDDSGEHDTGGKRPMQIATRKIKAGRKESLRAYFRKYWILYLFLLPALLDIILWHYVPMAGIQIAFKDFRIKQGIWGSGWVGLKHFQKFISSPNFMQILGNTLSITVLSLIFSFPVPILLAFMINEIRSPVLKKTTQMITYMPHFISLVAIVGLINLMLDSKSGILNMLIKALGGEAKNFMGMASAYRPIYIISEIWQNAGWGTIIYLSALSAVDMESLEAAKIDGANRLQKIAYIDFPTIMPTIVVLFIMSTGRLLSLGFDKVYLLQNDLNRSVSEVIATYTFRLGILGGQFSYTAAIGLFNNVINALVLVLVNQLAKKVGSASLW